MAPHHRIEPDSDFEDDHGEEYYDEPYEDQDDACVPPPIPRKSPQRTPEPQQGPQRFNFSYPHRRSQFSDSQRAVPKRPGAALRTSSLETIWSTADSTTSTQRTGSTASYDTSSTEPGSSTTGSSIAGSSVSGFSFFNASLLERKSTSETMRIERRVSVDQQSEHFDPNQPEDKQSGWTASSHDTSGLTVEEIHKLKKKGINPALYAEMKAARKGKGKFLSPLVGNTYIG